MDQPAVAILLATYNGAKHLSAQLDSLLLQTYSNFTIHISDDASSDKTCEIIEEYAKRFPDKFMYTKNETNIGYVKNFEKLLTKCTEKYLAFCDQDDIWHENKLSLQIAAMQELEKKFPNEACLVHSDLRVINKDNATIKKSYFKFRGYRLKDKKDLGHVLGPCGVMGNTILMNAQLKKVVLPFPEFLDVHDYYVAVICELFGHRKTLNMALIDYRIHEHNSSNNNKNFAKKNFFKKFIERKFTLPNLDTKRKIFLPPLLTIIQDKQDLKILQSYIEYLEFKQNRFTIFINLLRYSLVKRDLMFRTKLFFKFFWTTRYSANDRI